ncbi:MAG: hypothetical protein K2G69_04390 [Muribaculaceae bacterium]|nr:hypothetical protein [Muribaculaceae bacterium]
MSEVKKFADCPATTKPSFLLCGSENGEVQRIANVNLIAAQSASLQVTGKQWVRLFSYTSLANVVFILGKNFYTNPGGNIIINAALRQELNFSNLDVVSTVLNSSSTNPFEKMRIVRGESESYVDFYHNVDGKNELCLTILPNNSNISIMMSANATVPEGYTSKEVSLLGGVNRYRSTNYTILQKGGLRDERSEETQSGGYSEQYWNNQPIKGIAYRLRREPQTNRDGLSDDVRLRFGLDGCERTDGNGDISHTEYLHQCSFRHFPRHIDSLQVFQRLSGIVDSEWHKCKFEDIFQGVIRQRLVRLERGCHKVVRREVVAA